MIIFIFQFCNANFLWHSQKEVILRYSPSVEGVAAIADGVVSSSSPRCTIPLLVEGVATEGRRGSVGNKRQDLFEKPSAIGYRHYPVFSHKFALMRKSTPSKKGEFISSAFVFHSQKKVATEG